MGFETVVNVTQGYLNNTALQMNLILE